MKYPYVIAIVLGTASALSLGIRPDQNVEYELIARASLPAASKGDSAASRLDTVYKDTTVEDILPRAQPNSDPATVQKPVMTNGNLLDMIERYRNGGSNTLSPTVEAFYLNKDDLDLDAVTDWRLKVRRDIVKFMHEP